jgi:hypothetical protein
MFCWSELVGDTPNRVCFQGGALIQWTGGECWLLEPPTAVSRPDWSLFADLSNTLGSESEGFADLEDGVRHDGVGTSLRRPGCREVDCSVETIDHIQRLFSE